MTKIKKEHRLYLGHDEEVPSGSTSTSFDIIGEIQYSKTLIRKGEWQKFSR